MNRLHSPRLLLLSLAALLPTLAKAEAQLIVQLQPGANAQTVATRAGVALRGVTPNAPFALLGVTSGTAADAQRRLQSDSANVVWAEDNAEAQNPESAAAKNPTVRKGSSLSAIGDRHAVVERNANALGQVGWSAMLAAAPGRTVRIAILDNGLSRRQTALWSKVDASLDTTGGNADDIPMGIDSDRDGTPDAAVGHGTMIAGIADAVAPQVRFVIAKVADSDGHATAWSVVQGLAFSANAGAEVANLSMGSAQAIAAFNDVAEWCDSKGLLVVAPSGNAATGRAWYPARSSKALCVVGLNADNTLASFSNWDGHATASAPAVGITGQWWNGEMGIWSGTSFSAPFVAAGLADCLRRTSRQSPRTLIRAVNSSGTNIDRLNNRYKGEIGMLLNIVALDRALRSKA